MAFNVRLFGYAGVSQFHVHYSDRFGSDAIHQLTQPYLWASGPMQTSGDLPIDFSTTQVPSWQTHDKTAILRVEIDEGEAIRYEVGPQGLAAQASANSPILIGIQHIEFAPGWLFSFVEANVVVTPSDQSDNLPAGVP